LAAEVVGVGIEVVGAEVVGVAVAGCAVVGCAVVGCGTGPEFVGVDLLDPPQAASRPSAPASAAARITVLTGRTFLDTTLATPWFTQFLVGALCA